MQKRLFRSVRNKVITGTAAGIAEYLDIDPVLVRIGFVLLTVFHGMGILIYITCAIVMPREDVAAEPVTSADPAVQVENPELKPARGKVKAGARTIFGVVLIILGGIMLLDNFVPSVDFEDIFPFLLLVAGGWLLLRGIESERGNQ